MYDTRNNLTLDKYIIDEALHFSLESEQLCNTKNLSNIDKFYLVMIRVLNKDSNILVYNYISYPYIFYYTFLVFIATRNKYSSVNNHVYRQAGDFLSIFDDRLNISDVKDKLFISNNTIDFKKIIDNLYHFPHTLTNVEVFKIIDRLILQVNIDSMSYLTSLALNKEYKVFVKEVLSTLDDCHGLVKHLDDNIKPLSIINGCLFVVQDIKKFVESIRNYNYNINTGPQSHRGQVNSINNSLSILDMEYRKSLYNHNNYHVIKGNIASVFKLNRDKFSFNNIHMNLGGIKWYSTSTKANIKINNNFVNPEIIKNKFVINNDLTNKSLVPRGVNLYSTVGRKFTQVELNMIKLPCFVKSVIMGILLSDGSLVFAGIRSKNAYLTLTQSLGHSDYIHFVFNILAHYCSRYPAFRKRNRYGKSLYSLVLCTRSMSCITELHKHYYINKTEVVKLSIYNDLTPVALAHWIMGDGTFNGVTLLLCTDSYSIKEVVLLMNVLIIKYDIHCNIRYFKSHLPRIYIIKKTYV